jgi:hypothetical protein
VRGSNGASWNKHRLDGISVTLKVVADTLHGKGLTQSVSSNSVCLVEQRPLSLHSRNLALLDHREDSSNVFSHNPSGLDFIDGAIH